MYNLNTLYLKGKVKTIIRKTYELFSTPDDSGNPSNEYERQFIEDEEYVFSENGNLIESCRCDSQGKMIELHLFDRDNNGRLIEDSFYTPNGLLFRTVHQYSQQWRNLGRVNYLAESLMMDFSLNVFDDKGRHYSTEYYNNEGLLTEKVDYSLNEQGASVGLNHFRSDGSIKYRDYSKVNANLVEVERYSECIESFCTTFVQYDDNHNELKRVTHYGKGAVKEHVDYKYEFDHCQNWIKKQEYKNGQLHRVYIRDIEYC